MFDYPGTILYRFVDISIAPQDYHAKTTQQISGMFHIVLVYEFLHPQFTDMWHAMAFVIPS